MTAMQQQQQPSTITLPLTLPISDPPLCVIIAHSSANANLDVHSVVLAASEGRLWEGDLQHELAGDDKSNTGASFGVGGRLSCLDKLAVPLLQKKG